MKDVLDIIHWGLFESMLLADYQSYADCQTRVSAAFPDQDRWAKMAIFNIAKMGKFSSDRTIKQYADEIWRTKPVPG